ncbi:MULTISPECIES: hypothetical protein [Hyphomonas]|jgi:hypothetical protein|nr:MULTISPECIES: hypothetical protein [Hyphomonas]|tara:strand:+ start:61 stop:750 length:690 start_codon:yes stop_codon:yes gene_type:complete
MDAESRHCEVLRYTHAFSELKSSHHFLYDFPWDAGDTSFDRVIFGINPGETKQDWKTCPDSAQPQTRVRNFRDEYQVNRLSTNSVKWRNCVEYYCGLKGSLQTEFFFWSSPRTNSKFVERFGRPLEECEDHLKFCMRMNKILLDEVKPKSVIAPGLSSAKFAKYYSLSFESIIRASNHHRLVELWRDESGLPWLFTKHWTGARFFTKDQKEDIRAAIKAVELTDQLPNY